MDARMVNISLCGAQLALERMRIGSYHLVIGDRPGALYLSIPLPEGTIEPVIGVKYYDWSDTLKAFSVGVSFIDLDKEMEARLLRAFADLPTV